MRTAIGYTLLLLALVPTVVWAQEEGAGGLLSPHGGLMFWTLVIFVILLIVLSKFAFKPLTAAVEARERALREAIESARHDREEAAKLVEEQRRQLEAARVEAQRYIVEGRQAGERIRSEILEQTRLQQQELLERARREIESERDRAIAELRREAVDLALRGAGKVIEKNLDDPTNRQLVERFLASVETQTVTRAG